MILKLEQQVCSLESAKRLKELGVRQESLFYWDEYSKLKTTNTWNGNKPNGGREYFEDRIYKIRDSKPTSGQRLMQKVGPYVWGIEWGHDSYSAYTVAELGELLMPQDIAIFTRRQFTLNWEIWKMDAVGKTYVSDCEAETRAKMLIYVLGNRLINKE